VEGGKAFFRACVLGDRPSLRVWSGHTQKDQVGSLLPFLFGKVDSASVPEDSCPLGFLGVKENIEGIL
jgi:hypothetical protein